MADFNFSARDGAGQVVNSSVRAADRKEALRKIRSRGLTPIKVSSGGATGTTEPVKEKNRKAKREKTKAKPKSNKKVKVSGRHVLP
jgi:type II secretory pathway component PulF